MKYRVTHEVGGGSKIKAVEGTNLQYDCMAIADANPSPPFPSVAQTSGETKNTSRITVMHRRDGKYTVDCLHKFHLLIPSLISFFATEGITP